MVFSRRMIARFLVFSMATFLVMTGCSKQQQDTKAPVPKAALGIVDMEKIIKLHPRYNEYQALRLQINALNYELEANADTASLENAQELSSAFQQTQITNGVKTNQELEINAKVLQKQSELQNQFDKKKAQLEQSLAAELSAYGNEVAKEYELPLFNLKLKLKTANLSQSDAEAAKTEMDKLENEQQQKVAAKEAALVNRLNNALSAEYQRLEAELSAYQDQVMKTMESQINSLAVSNGPKPQAVVDTSAQVKLTQKLSELEQKIATLQQQIIADIQNKAGQIAVEKGLDTVIANTKVNIQAIDITDLVIAGLKK